MALLDLKELLEREFNRREKTFSSTLILDENSLMTEIHYEYISFGNGLKLTLHEQIVRENFALYNVDFSFFGDVDEIIMNDFLFNNIVQLNKRIFEHCQKVGLAGYCVALSSQSYTKQEKVLFNYISKMISSVKDTNKRLLFKNLIFPKLETFSSSSILVLNNEFYIYLEKIVVRLREIADFLRNQPLLYNSYSLRKKGYIFESFIYNGEVHFNLNSKFVSCTLDYIKGVIRFSSAQEYRDIKILDANAEKEIEKFLEEIKTINEIHTLLHRDFTFLKDFIRREFLLFNFNAPYFTFLKDKILQHFDYDEFEVGLQKNLLNNSVSFEKIYRNNNVEFCARKFKISNITLVFYEDFTSNSVELKLKK